MELLRRLLSHTKRDGACLLWTGAVNHKGYGQMTFENVHISTVHRTMYELVHGPIPKGEQVAHTCDVPNCIEPDHLALATAQQNSMDMVRKRRYKVISPLTEDDVRFIRDSASSTLALAWKFNVNEKTIRNIRNRKTWTHI